MLMPSLFEPCGLPQMTAPLYGSLPVVHSTGGLYDTIQPLDVEQSTGNGFRFDHYDAPAFRWAIDRAMDFYQLPCEIREREVRRVMIESRHQFSHKEVARRYIDIYEQMLARPLVEKESGEVIKAIAESLSESLAGSLPQKLVETRV
jgi:glycogen synthase